MDDIWAISYAIARSDLFSIRMVLTGSFNTTGRAQVAAQFLERLGRSDIPVGIGLHTPPNPGLQGGVGPEWPWAATYNLAAYPGVVEKDGVGALRRELEAATPESPLWILGIGPYTNIAAVIGKRPDLARNARFLTMGGSVAIGYDGSPPVVAEYNVVTDIPAAQTVFSAPWQMPIVVAPLDTTLFFQVRDSGRRNAIPQRCLPPLKSGRGRFCGVYACADCRRDVQRIRQGCRVFDAPSAKVVAGELPRLVRQRRERLG